MRAFRDKIRANGLFLGGRLKGGGKNAPQHNLAPLLDSEFDAGYDFATKHDPIQLGA